MTHRTKPPTDIRLPGEIKDTGIHLRIPSKYKRLAIEKARSEGRSLTSVIRDFLVAWCDDRVVKPPASAQINRSAKTGRKASTRVKSSF